MLKLYHFVKYIKPYNESVKDYLKPKSEEQIKNIISNMDDNSKFANAIRYGIIDMMLEISDKYQNVGVINTIIDTSCKKGYYKAIDELLKRDYFLKVIKSDDIYNSLYTTSHNNVLLEHITEAIKKGHLDIAERMLNDKNIIQLLSEEDIEMLGDYLYLSKKAKEKNISLNKNESVKDYLKPKSKEDILKSADNLERFEKLQVGSEYGVLYLVKKAVEMGINPGMDNNRAIRIAAKNGHYDVVEYLLSLKDKRVDPNHDDSITIKLASHNGHYDIVKLLLNDERVKNSEYIKKIHTLVNKDDRTESWNIDSILKTLKYINESKVSDFLKPKSEEDIINSMKELPTFEKILKGCKHGLVSIVKKAIDEENIRPDWNYNMGLRQATNYGQVDVVKYLLSFDKVNPFQVPIDRGRNAFNTALDLIGHPSVHNNKPYFDILKLFASDDVLNRFVDDEDDRKYYKKMAGLSVNESIRQHLKPKSEEEMKNSLKTMSKEDKNKIMYDFIKKDDIKMMLFMLNNGLEINSHMINVASTCHNLTAINLLRYIREKRNKNK